MEGNGVANNPFENQINKLVDSIIKSGYFGTKLHPHRLHDGTYVDGEPFDYMIALPEYKACFDAKSIHGDSWKFEKKDIKQAANLKHCKNAGLDSFFIVYFFKLRKMIKFDVDVFLNVLAEKRKYLKPDEGTEWREIDGIIKQLNK